MRNMILSKDMIRALKSMLTLFRMRWGKNYPTWGFFLNYSKFHWLKFIFTYFQSFSRGVSIFHGKFSIVLNFFVDVKILKSKNTNVSEHKFLIRKAATQNFSCNLLLLSCWECSEYIVMLEGFSKITPQEIF